MGNMLSVINWQLNDFAQQVNYIQLKKQVDECWRFDDINLAWRLYKELVKQEEVWAKLKDKELRAAYNKLRRRLAYIALPLLEDNEVEGILKTDLAQALSYQPDDYNLLDKINGKLIILPLVEQDNYRVKLIKALEENEEELTEVSIDKDGGQVEGTIKNWLADFRYYLAEHKADEKLARAQYLYKGKNIMKLGEVDRGKVKRLVELYNQLHKLSFTFEGHEEPTLVKDEGESYLIYKGKIIRLNDQPAVDKGIVRLGQAKLASVASAEKKNKPRLLSAQPTIVRQPPGNKPKEIRLKPENTKQGDTEANLLTKLQRNYQAFLQMALIQEVDKEIEKLLATNKNDFRNLRGYFYHAVNRKQVEQALAALLAIAKLGKIRQAFGEDERFVKFWFKYLSAKNLAAERFKKDPAKAEFLARFFKYILEERLELPADEAVLIGMLIANLCRQAKELEYQSIVYGDVRNGEFKWNI